MTDKEFYEALQPLETAMKTFAETNEGALTATEVGILKELYPELKARATNGGLPRTFNSGCSSCIREVFSVYISVYFRLKKESESAGDSKV